MTWVAFDRAIKSAETFGFKAPLDEWRSLRDTICRDVCEKGFDTELNSFVESYGSKMLDASVLLLPSVGFLPPDDPRVRGTHRGDRKAHDARRLRAAPRSARGHRDRSRPRARSSPARCGSRTPMCWPATSTRRRRCSIAWSAIANDLGLLAEEYDSGAKRQAGNFPQALTHIALINTAHNLDEARKHSEKPAVQRSK